MNSRHRQTVTRCASPYAPRAGPRRVIRRASSGAPRRMLVHVERDAVPGRAADDAAVHVHTSESANSAGSIVARWLRPRSSRPREEPRRARLAARQSARPSQRAPLESTFTRAATIRRRLDAAVDQHAGRANAGARRHRARAPAGSSSASKSHATHGTPPCPRFRRRGPRSGVHLPTRSRCRNAVAGTAARGRPSRAAPAADPGAAFHTAAPASASRSTGRRARAQGEVSAAAAARGRRRHQDVVSRVLRPRASSRRTSTVLPGSTPASQLSTSTTRCTAIGGLPPQRNTSKRSVSGRPGVRRAAAPRGEGRIAAATGGRSATPSGLGA